jgi:hypothetical protein
MLIVDLQLRGWQGLGGLLVYRVIHAHDLYQVLLVTHSWLLKLLLLLHR